MLTPMANEIVFDTKTEADDEISELAASKDRHISDWQIHDNLGGVYSRENKCTADIDGINPDYPETYVPAA